jgi:uncharacterized protein
VSVPRIPLTSVLVKPAGPDCNMDCQYCFYLDRAVLFPGATHRMSDQVLEEMTRQMMSQPLRQFSFGWQGGEPTLMGLPFFQKVVYWQNRLGNGKSVGNGLQTNGLLLDGEWASFLSEYKFLVGLSFDGPRHLHDHYRILRGGQGTWAAVADRVKMLLDAGVDVNALSVVTDYSAAHAEEIYIFHKEMGLRHMQFIPCVETDPRDPSRAAPFSVSPESYGNFLIKLFDLWLADIHDGVATTFVRYFDSVFHKYVNLTPPDCTLGERCGNYLVVEHNGDVFSCDFFVEPAWKLGNVLEGQMVDMLNSSRQQEFGAMKAARPEVCTQCRWLRQCYGGCTKDRLRDPADMGNMHFCQSYMMFFEHADRALKDLAGVWVRQQQQAATDMALHSSGSTEVPGRNAPCSCGSGKKYKVCCGAPAPPAAPFPQDFPL